MNTIPICESKKSDKVIIFCTGVYQLMKYTTQKNAKKICEAAENGNLYGVYFIKNGKIKATYL